MTSPIKTLLVAAATIAATTLQSIPAQACGGRGGGRSVSIGRVGISVARSHVYRPVHRAVYAPPHYAQPQYAQPQYAQPRPVYTPQPIQPQPGFAGQVAPANQVVTAPAPANRAPANTAPTPRQPVTPAPSQNTTDSSEASALQMLASLSTNNEPTAGQNVTQIPEFTAATSATTTPHVGTWKVNLPGNQSVELVLDDNNGFRWTATKDGKSNSFQGQFRLENNRLTLVRSNDLQQMTGSWTGQGGNFTFKLDGATTGGLAFVRS